jgi:hypothetical protein
MAGTGRGRDPGRRDEAAALNGPGRRGSIALYPLVILVFIPRGRVFAAALGDAVDRQAITPELRAAFADPVVHAAHCVEVVLVVSVLTLMVVKPF